MIDPGPIHAQPTPPRGRQATLDYQPVDHELHTESVGQVVRAMIVVFAIIGVLIFLACGGMVGVFQGMAAPFGY